MLHCCLQTPLRLADFPIFTHKVGVPAKFLVWFCGHFVLFLNCFAVGWFKIWMVQDLEIKPLQQYYGWLFLSLTLCTLYCFFISTRFKVLGMQRLHVQEQHWHLQNKHDYQKDSQIKKNAVCKLWIKLLPKKLAIHDLHDQ